MPDRAIGTFNLKRSGITCALCHSTVDDSFAPGIGHRLDGWANRDLDIGAIIASAPSLAPFVQLLARDEQTIPAELQSWGPGASTRSRIGTDSSTSGPSRTS